MKKKIVCLLLMLLLASFFTLPAYAESSESTGWQVTFTSGQQLESNFKQNNIDTLISGLQPGDSLHMQIAVKNEYSKQVDFFMKNEVIRSLEASGASGGGYTYILTYTNPSGSTTDLYRNDQVGGDNPKQNYEGLKEATANLKDYFYLDTIASGRSGKVDLTVSLDGETQGNAYQTKSADIRFQFAVEVPETSKRTVIVRTGDEYNMVPFYIAMVVSGLVFLYLALDSITDRIYYRKKG